MGGKKPSEKIAEMEKAAGPAKTMFVPQGPSDDDIPSMIAMADSYVKSGAFDEAIEMYQKALAMDPANQSIKKKLNEVYSKYAGMPVAGAPDQEAKKKEEEAKRKTEEEMKAKKEEEERKKKDEAQKKKAEEEAKKKKDDEDRKKKDEEARKKTEEESKRKKEEEDRKKKDEEAKRKRDEEEKKKRDEDEKKKKASADEDITDDQYSDDFVTVTTAEIFIKQGLFTEAEKILGKILKKDPANIEARMKLDEMKKLQTETEQKGENVMDEEVKKGQSSKVTYI
jgi:tetratricopeptide (TPR) repeat protein